MAAPKGNKFAIGNTGGRPPIYSNAEELCIKINEYFNICSEGEKATITGLALYLGFCTRKSLDDNEGRSEEFLYTIKRAKLAVENSYEMSGQTIDIFALKNMDWHDKTETEHTGNITLHFDHDDANL
jgi:hypothetical protein